MGLRVRFEQIDNSIGKKNIEKSINEINELLNLITEKEDNIRDWRPKE